MRLRVVFMCFLLSTTTLFSRAESKSTNATASLTTAASTTTAATSAASTTTASTTVSSTTAAPTTKTPTTAVPTTKTTTTTAAPTTKTPTTAVPTTAAPTTAAPTTEAPTTEAPTTAAPTTEAIPRFQCENNTLIIARCPQMTFLTGVVSRGALLSGTFGPVCSRVIPDLYVGNETQALRITDNDSLEISCDGENEAIVGMKMCVEQLSILEMSVYCRTVRHPDRLGESHSRTNEAKMSNMAWCGSKAPAAVKKIHFNNMTEVPSEVIVYCTDYQT